MNPVWVVTSILAFFAFCFFVAHWGKLKTGKSIEEYFIAGRKVGGLIAALTYSATTYSAFMMVGLVGLTAIHGVGALGFELIYLMGLVLAVVFGLKLHIIGKKWELITPAHFMAKRYNSPLMGLTVALLYHVFLIPYMAAQLIGSGTLLSSLTGGVLSFEAGTLIVGVMAFLYTLWGGMRAVAWTDAVQALLMLSSSILMLVLVFQLAGGFGNAIIKLAEKPELLSLPGPYKRFTPQAFISMTIPWFFFSISNPQVVQRFFITKDARSLKNMIRGFLVFGFIYTVIVTLIGLVASIVIPGVRDQNAVTPTLLTMIPEPLAIVVLIGILAASMSTLDSIMLTLSSELSVSVVKTIKPSCSEETALKVGKALMVLILSATIFFSFTKGLIVELALTSSSWLLQLVPAFIGGLIWKRCGALSAGLSVFSGVATATLMFLLNINALDIDPGIWGFLIATIVLVTLSLLRGASTSRCGDAKAESSL
ncbi:MAG: sodium:solute symporter family protein [Candidatus Nezhaarchaeota archaeon]|nr:sodium:solute symporter family protein [Candidatus Nezhaarchaeota archaeon]